MRTRNFIAITALSMALAACGGGEPEQNSEAEQVEEVKNEKEEKVAYAEASFKDGAVSTAYQHYLKIQQALVKSDDEAVRNAAASLAEDLTDQHQDWKNLATRMSETEDLEQQRQQFEELTEALEPTLRESIKSGAVYKQYCPMAFNNKGAHWFSESKEIKNPYFGDKMLKCGNTKEVIQ